MASLREFNKIGIVIPTIMEMQPLLKLLPEMQKTQTHPWEIYEGAIGEIQVRAIISYIGPANTAAATERLMDFAPQLILHAGSAGSLNMDLLPGDIVIGRRYKILCSPEILAARKTLLLSNKGIRYTANGEAFHLEELEGDDSCCEIASDISTTLLNNIPEWNFGGWPSDHPKRQPIVFNGSIGSQDGWTKDKLSLDYIRKEFAVDCEDMESAFTAQVAAKHAVPFLSIRGISNNEYYATLAKSEILPAIQEAAARATMFLAHMIRDSFQNTTA